MEKLGNYKTPIAVVLVLLALFSATFGGRWAASPERYASLTASVDEKTETVLKLTGAATLASAAVSAIPGDTATPIAEKLADFTEYFLLILCVLCAEKLMLPILGKLALRWVFPAALVLIAVSLFIRRDALRRLGGRLILMGLCLSLLLPVSIRGSDLIYNAYAPTVRAAVASAEEFSEKTGDLAQAGEDESAIRGILSRISESVDTLREKAAAILSQYVETLAVMIVTSCLLPLLTLLVFIWIIKQLTGLDLGPKVLPGSRRRDR